MKNYFWVLNLGITIICSIALFGYIGYLLGHMAAGIIIGTLMSIFYMLYQVFRKEK